jgi:hypothetical protein
MRRGATMDPAFWTGAPGWRAKKARPSTVSARSANASTPAAQLGPDPPDRTWRDQGQGGLLWYALANNIVQSQRLAAA